MPVAARALIAAAIADARPLPGVAYTSPDIFALEQARIFATQWRCVGRGDEVELPGQWLREVVAGAPILVVRGADLRLRAFHYACRHRGHRSSLERNADATRASSVRTTAGPTSSMDAPRCPRRDRGRLRLRHARRGDASA